MRRAYLLILFCFVCCPVFLTQRGYAQDSSAFFIRNAEEALDQKNYTASLENLRKFFGLGVPVSSNVEFLYAKAMLGMKHYVASRDAILRLLATDTQRVYFDEAHIILDSANHNICPFCNNTGIREIETPCGKCNGEGRVYSGTCPLCDGKGQAICPVCRGKGILKGASELGSVFKPCKNCQGKGYVVCPRCHGKKQEGHLCDVCNGKGKMKLKTTCDHKSD